MRKSKKDQISNLSNLKVGDWTYWLKSVDNPLISLWPIVGTISHMKSTLVLISIIFFKERRWFLTLVIDFYFFYHICLLEANHTLAKYSGPGSRPDGHIALPFMAVVLGKGLDSLVSLICNASITIALISWVIVSNQMPWYILTTVPLSW